MKTITNLTTGEAVSIVNSTNTALAVGSGLLDVLGTPCMIALMEKATCNAVCDYLDDGETTVGTAININHTKATGIGVAIKATATLKPENVDGRKLTFDVTAIEQNGAVIGSGTIERFVVLSDRFMKKVEESNV